MDQYDAEQYQTNEQCTTEQRSEARYTNFVKIENMKVFPTDVEWPHEVGILSLEEWLWAGPSKNCIREPDKTVAADHVVWCLVTLNRVLSSLTKTRISCCTKHRIEGITSMYCVRYVRIEAKDHRAQ